MGRPIRLVLWLVVIFALVALSVVGQRLSSRHANIPAETMGPLPALGQAHLLVEKAAHRLKLFDGQELIRTYGAAFGPARPDKVREGDGCTPEGEFCICTKNPKSRFTLSLGLSYPNAQDAARGLRDKLISQAQHDQIVQATAVGRQPPWNTPLGGEIMIHGGGNGRDWTGGCTALEDEHIRQLFDALPIGTPVRIVP